MAHLKIRTGHQSTPTQDVQGAIQPQENSMLKDLKDLKVGVSKHTSIPRDNEDTPKTSTTNSTPRLIHWDQHSASSRRMHNLQNLKRVLKEIGQGKSPTSTIVDGTSPQYWTIRTDNEGYADELRQDIEDRVSLKDQRSRDEHKLWRKRGGQGAGLRVRANYLSQFFIDHVAIRLVDGASGNSCVGTNFVAQHDDNKKENKRKNKDNDEEKGRGRFFMLVEDELSRNPEKLRLRMRKVAGSFGLRFSLEHLKTLLREAPVLIVMADVGIDQVFWDQHALRDIAKERCSNRW
jgi:hypothetical protein